MLLIVIMLVPFVDPVSAFDLTTRSAGLQSSGCTGIVATDQRKPGIVRCGFYASEDAFVDNLMPTKEFGEVNVLAVQDTPSVPRLENYAYLKFDLSSLSSLLPALDATVNSTK